MLDTIPGTSSRAFALVGSSLVLAGPVWAATPAPLGGDLQVNTYTTQAQGTPDVGVAPGGAFTVVWRSDRGPEGEDEGVGIRAQRFDSTGAPAGGEFQVNAYADAGQQAPALAIDPATGASVVVWESLGADPAPGTWAVAARLYGSDGTPVGTELLVNEFSAGDQRAPDVAFLTSGGFAVVWRTSEAGAGTDPDGAIEAKTFDASGVGVGTEFQVNTYTTGAQLAPRIVSDPSDGDVLVVWESSGPLVRSDGDESSIRAARFDSAGGVAQAEFQVNEVTTNSQTDPVVAFDGAGSFVVAWQSAYFVPGGNDASGFAISGRRFASDGTEIGDEFQVNQYTTGSQTGPSVAVASAGDFVVAWSSDAGALDADGTVRALRFAADGTANGAEFQVNGNTTGAQGAPVVALQPDGKVVAAFESDTSSGTDTDLSSVQVRRFGITPNVVASKTVSAGPYAEGGSIVYTIVLENVGGDDQPDDPNSNELEDVLPDGLTLVNAQVLSGGGSAVPGPNDTVTWNGTIAAASTVSIQIDATVDAGTYGRELANQGTVSYDSDGDDVNDAVRVTDDPTRPGAEDLTPLCVGDDQPTGCIFPDDFESQDLSAWAGNVG